NDYQLYGSVTSIFGEQINGKIIKFKATNVFGFTVIIKNIDKITNDSRKMIINWMLVGNPEIINIAEPENIDKFSHKNSHIQNFIILRVGSQEVSLNQVNNWVISLPTLPKLPINSIFAYSFKYPSSNSDSSLLSCAKFDGSNNIQINITNYTDYNDELKDNFKYQIHWCIYITSIQKVTIGQFIFEEDLAKTIRMIKNKPPAKACASKKEKDNYEAILTKKHKEEIPENIKQIMAGTSNELNESISNSIEAVIKRINNEGNEVIKKYEYNLFSNLMLIRSGRFGNICKATWENSTIVLKNITIDTSIIDSEIINEIKNAINTNKIISFDDTIVDNKFIISNAIKLFINETSHEKWIESKIIEGKINEYNIDEFEDYKLISSGATSKVYRARYKSTKNLCALKFIEKNNHTNKELVNELYHMLSIESHENIIKFHVSLPAKIRDEGLREKPNADTPHEYDNRPSIEEVAMMFEDFIIGDITENDNFDIFYISGFEEFITNALGKINFNIKLDATAFGQDEMTCFVYDLYSNYLMKAAENKCAAAEHMLGEYFYKLRRYNKAFYYLKRATENGNYKALNTLGLCYQRGQGTNINAVEGFRSFKRAALWGLPTSQYELGNCYEYGIGTEINLKEALIWYQKATDANPNYLIHEKRAKLKF
ncbi:18382_t:CDS:2, partial [Gigaspora rosea]